MLTNDFSRLRHDEAESAIAKLKELSIGIFCSRIELNNYLVSVCSRRSPRRNKVKFCPINLM
ncbi:MAG: hypothetical protein ACFCAD_25105 [Pleurocapsa sp.]